MPVFVLVPLKRAKIENPPKYFLAGEWIKKSLEHYT